MISANFARSGGPLVAALITSAHSRKYCGPRAAGVITQSAFASWAPLFIEPVSCASRNAECLTRPDVNLFSVHSPGQQALDAVDRLFVWSWLCAGAARRCAPGTTSSKAAMLPVELPPVSKKRTARGPRRTVSSEGLTRRSMVCCGMCHRRGCSFQRGLTFAAATVIEPTGISTERSTR